MRFIWKIILGAMLAAALTTGALGTVFLERSLEREMHAQAVRAEEESRLLCYTLVTAVQSGIPDSPFVSRRIMGEVCDALESEGLTLDIAEGTAFPSAETQGQTAAPDDFAWNWQREEETYTLVAQRRFGVGEAVYCLTSERDVSPVFASFAADRKTLLICTGAAMLLWALGFAWLSGGMARTVDQVAAAARRMARGDYDRHIRVRGSSDAAELADSFDSMAWAMEEKIADLEQVARQREEFVGSFAHELKTPLTAMIGYADMIRSRQMEPEKVFRAANYIFTEGRRLEALSLKLLKLTVMRHQDHAFHWVSAAWLLEDIGGFLEPVMEQAGMTLTVEAEDAGVYVDTDLIRTLLMNLVDNARKASDEGSSITVRGIRVEGGYRVTVIDRGRGIPAAELHKVTEAFYMVDKSRARAQNGAGLGLALCRQIAEIHGTQLHIASRPGEGTQVSILLKTAQRQRRGRRGGM